MSEEYEPGFTYLNQCGNNILRAYVPVYMVINIVMAFFFPFFIFFLASYPADKVPCGMIYVWDGYIWPREAQGDGYMLIATDRIVTLQILNVATMMTFGIANPLLGVAVGITIITHTLMFQLLIGRYLMLSPRANVSLSPDKRVSTELPSHETAGRQGGGGGGGRAVALTAARGARVASFTMVRDVSSGDPAGEGAADTRTELPLSPLFSVVEEEEEGGDVPVESVVTPVDEAATEGGAGTGRAHSSISPLFSPLSLFRPVSVTRTPESSELARAPEPAPEPEPEPGHVMEAKKEGGAFKGRAHSSMSTVFRPVSVPKENETVGKSGGERSTVGEGEAQPPNNKAQPMSMERGVSQNGTDPSGGLDDACGDVRSAIKGVVWLVVWSSSIFMAVFLYDVTADSAGPDAARTTVSVVIVAPLIIYILYHTCVNISVLLFRHCGGYMSVSSDIGASCYGRMSTSLGYMKDSIQACYYVTIDKVKSSLGMVVVHRNEHFMHNPDTEMANVRVTVL